MTRRFLNFFIAAILFSMYCVRLWLASLNKPFWTDEAVGINGSLTNSFSQLLAHGPGGEASPSPLPYLIEKNFTLTWNLEPHRWWNLRLFFRILPVTYWAIACVAVFFFMLFYIKERIPHIKYWQLLLISIATSTFYHSNNFASYYAIETRSYSPWLLFSTLHFLFFIYSLDHKLSKKKWALYALISVAMVMTTYVSLSQVGLALFIQFIFTKKEDEPWFSKERLLGPIFVIMISFLVMIKYFSHVAQYNFGFLPYSLYASSLIEVVSKAFHNHGWQSTIVIFPICGILPTIIWRKIRNIQAIYLYGWLQLAISFALFLGCRWKGNLFASRYVIFLTPMLTCFYAVGLVMIFSFVEKKWRRITLIHLLILWSALEVTIRIPSYAKTIVKDTAFLSQYNAYGLTTNPECPAQIPNIRNFEEFEAFNTMCRKK